MTVGTAIFDVETDGFRPTVVHCLAIKLHETGESFVFADQPGYHSIEDGLALLEDADVVVAHNGKAFDVPQLRRLYPNFRVDEGRIVDTLLLARSMFPKVGETDDAMGVPSSLKNRHKLAAWGFRLGVLKGDFSENADWSRFTPEMASYCVQDVEVTDQLYSLIAAAAEAECANHG